MRRAQLACSVQIYQPRNLKQIILHLGKHKVLEMLCLHLFQENSEIQFYN